MKKISSEICKLSLPVKAAFWFTICNILLKGISLISAPIYTRVMSEEEYGILSLFLSYEQIILILATFEIPIGAYQKGLFKYKEEQKLFNASSQLLTNIITIMCFVIIFVLYKPFSTITGMSYLVLLLLLGYLLVQPAYNSWVVYKRTEYQYKSVVIATLLFSVINVIIPLLALVVLDSTAEVKFGAQMIISIVFCIPFFLRNVHYKEILINWDNVKEHWSFLIKFQGPLVLHSLSYLILAQADRIMIGVMVGADKAGYYSIAYNLAMVITLFQNSITQVLTPWRYDKMEKKQYIDIRKNTNYMLMAIGVLILGFILIAPEIMKIMFTANYYEAVWSIPPIAASVYFMFLYSIFVNIETYFEKTKYVTYVSLTCGVLNIILNYMLIDIFGYIVCGYTTLVSYVLFAVGHYIFMKKVCKENKLKEKIFDINIILAISVCIIFFTVAVTMFYQNWILRYALLLSIIVVACIFRKKIITIYKTIKSKG